MKKQDLNTILIIDSEYYNPKAAYKNLLNNNNITTIGQLLELNKKDNLRLVFKGYSGKTLDQLEGFISILEHKYLESPLLYEELMDQFIDFESGSQSYMTIQNYTLIHFYTTIKTANICKLLGAPNNVLYFPKFYKEYLSTKGKRERKDISLIQFIYWIYENKAYRYKSVEAYVKTYIDEYEKKKGSIGSSEELKKLKSELISLEEEKEKLNKRISELKKEIKKLSNYNEKSRVKKWKKI